LFSAILVLNQAMSFVCSFDAHWEAQCPLDVPLRTFVTAWGNRDPMGQTHYSPDSIARSSRKRISSLLASEITKRTWPWLEVSA
jgi:hypothetical protein